MTSTNRTLTSPFCALTTPLRSAAALSTEANSTLTLATSAATMRVKARRVMRK